MVNSSINNQEPVKFPDLEPKGPPGSKVLEQERAKASFDVDALTKFHVWRAMATKPRKSTTCAWNGSCLWQEQAVFPKSSRTDPSCLWQGQTYYWISKVNHFVYATSKGKLLLNFDTCWCRQLKWSDMDRRVAGLLYDQASPVHLSCYFLAYKHILC